MYLLSKNKIIRLVVIMNTPLRLLEEKINYCFKNKLLMKEALVHRSYAGEKNLDYDNQRLEFLGDAVLEIVVTDYLFNLYPYKREGELTSLRASIVKKETLASLAEKITLDNFIFLGKGEKESGGNKSSSILCDAFEALIGAIYLDGGLEPAKKFIINLLNYSYSDIEKIIYYSNPKGILQEITQKKYSSKPSYHIKEQLGPEHDKEYIVDVKVNGYVVSTGKGKNIKSAESDAALSAINKLQNT